MNSRSFYGGLMKNDTEVSVSTLGNVSVGDTIKATVAKIHADGKIQLALREPAYLAINKDGEKILEVLRLNGGMIPFNDRSEPELIKKEFDMSKAAFKRACGHLWKERKIDITPRGINLVKE